MYEGLDTIVLQNELAIEDSLPFAWTPAALPLSQSLQNQYFESNARLLQVCMALDDQTPAEKNEEAAHSAELARLDMKMNLLLDLVGRLLLQNQPRPSPAKVCFNARGALWRVENGSTLVKKGEPGVFALYLHNCLVDPLRLTGHVHSSDGGNVEVRFDRGPEAIVNLIDKLTFRRHRRRIHDSRSTKRGS